MANKTTRTLGGVAVVAAGVAELKMLKWELPAEFASIMENASKGVPSAGPTTASPAEGEKKTNPTTKDADTTNLHTELVDLLGIDIVTTFP
ncbi:hypothetical protein Tco_0673437 [Tanacetum coccineum]